MTLKYVGYRCLGKPELTILDANEPRNQMVNDINVTTALSRDNNETVPRSVELYVSYLLGRGVGVFFCQPSLTCISMTPRCNNVKTNTMTPLMCNLFITTIIMTTVCYFLGSPLQQESVCYYVNNKYIILFYLQLHLPATTLFYIYFIS